MSEAECLELPKCLQTTHAGKTARPLLQKGDDLEEDADPVIAEEFEHLVAITRGKAMMKRRKWKLYLFERFLALFRR